jgi:hypothetical protein
MVCFIYKKVLVSIGCLHKTKIYYLDLISDYSVISTNFTVQGLLMVFNKSVTRKFIIESTKVRHSPYTELQAPSHPLFFISILIMYSSSCSCNFRRRCLPFESAQNYRRLKQTAAVCRAGSRATRGLPAL